MDWNQAIKELRGGRAVRRPVPNSTRVRVVKPAQRLPRCIPVVGDDGRDTCYLDDAPTLRDLLSVEWELDL